jgi:hypothetical protein
MSDTDPDDRGVCVEDFRKSAPALLTPEQLQDVERVFKSGFEGWPESFWRWFQDRTDLPNGSVVATSSPRVYEQLLHWVKTGKPSVSQQLMARDAKLKALPPSLPLEKPDVCSACGQSIVPHGEFMR